MPSIAISQLVGTETTSRTFTSVEGGTVTWTAGTEGLPGIDVTLPDPVVLTGVGDEAEWDVTFTRDGAALDEWVQGAITWTSDDGHAVRIPVVLKPTQLGFPTAVSAEVDGATGLVEWDVKSGYDGVLSADGYGLAADDVLAGETVAQDPDQDIETGTLTSGVTTYPYTLGANVRYFAAGTAGATTTAGSDLDVYLLFDENDDNVFEFDELVASAADGDSDEIAELVNPEPGDYLLIIHGWGTPGGGGSTYDLHQWIVDQATADTGTLVATVEGGDPAAVTTGDTFGIDAAVSGLSAAGQYRGVVTYRDASDELGTTVLVVDH